MENSLKLLTVEGVMLKLSIGRTMVYKLIKEHAFPKPLKVGRCSRWCESDIDSWITNLKT